MRSNRDERGKGFGRCLAGALLAGSLPLLAGFVEAREAGGGTQGAPGAAPAPPRVAVDGGAVTVQARDVSLRELLAEIGRGAGLEVELHGPLHERVTIELHRLPLREALGRILRGHGFVLRHVEPPPAAGSSASGESPNKLWVFSGRPGEARAGDGDARSGGEDAEGLDRLRLALADDDSKVRLQAVSELAGIGGARAVAAFAAAALQDAEASVREEAIYSLGQMGSDTDFATLEQALQDPELRVREAAVEALTDLGGETAAWALAPALDDPAPSLRGRAVYALAKIGGEVAVTLLRRALADEEGFIRRAAAEALDELASSEP